jgi:hypothetical protein
MHNTKVRPAAFHLSPLASLPPQAWAGIPFPHAKFILIFAAGRRSPQSANPMVMGGEVTTTPKLSLITNFRSPYSSCCQPTTSPPPTHISPTLHFKHHCSPLPHRSLRGRMASPPLSNPILCTLANRTSKYIDAHYLTQPNRLTLRYRCRNSRPGILFRVPLLPLLLTRYQRTRICIKSSTGDY